MEIKTTYFEKAGKENTEVVFRIAKQRAKELGIKTILVASSTGGTAVKAVEALSGYRLVIVTGSTGFREDNVQRFTEESRKICESKGAIVLTGTHAFAGVGRAVKLKYETTEIVDVIAHVLRIFGQGMKVVCEMAMMAADAGLVRTDEDVICVAGTGVGADTAVVLRPVHSHHFFDIKVREILCKPRL